MFARMNRKSPIVLMSVLLAMAFALATSSLFSASSGTRNSKHLRYRVNEDQEKNGGPVKHRRAVTAVNSPAAGVVKRSPTVVFTPPPLHCRPIDIPLPSISQHNHAETSVLLSAPSKPDLIIDPRPGKLSGAVEQLVSSSDPLKLAAPVKCYMEAVTQSLNSLQTVSQFRLMKVDICILETLRRICPEMLGGSNTETRITKYEEPGYWTSRGNTVPCYHESPIAQYDLVLLYELIVKACAALPLQSWKMPRHHGRFNQDGGWPVYILRVHQLVLATLRPAEDFECSKLQTEQVPFSSDEWGATGEANEFMKEASNKCSQSNIYETLSLWSLAVKAAALRSVSKNGVNQVIDSAYDEDRYREYHQLPSRHIEPSSTLDDTNEVKQSHDVQDRLTGGLLTYRNLPVGPRVDNEIVRSHSLYVVLIDGASDYQAVGTSPHDIAYMAAISDTPRTETGEIEPVSFVQIVERRKQVVIALDCDMISFAVNSSGRYDAYLWAIFMEMVIPFSKKIHWRLVIPPVFLPSDFLVYAKTTTVFAMSGAPDPYELPTSTRQMIMTRACHGLRVLRTCLRNEQWGETKCEYLGHMLLSSSQSAVNETLTDLVSEIWHSAFHRDNIAGLKRLEGLLVALLGHPDDKVRSRATVLLNAFYDQHDWQMDVPFVQVIREVGDNFEISISIDDAADPAKRQEPWGVFVVLFAPSFNIDSPTQVYSYHSIKWKSTESLKGRIPGISMHSAQAGRPKSGQQRHKWIGSLSFNKFPRCGFYDWRVVRINEQYGSWDTVQAAFNDIRRSASSSYLLDLRISLTPDDRDVPKGMGDPDNMVVGKVYPHPQRMAEMLKGLLSPGCAPRFYNEEHRTFALQGRFIVQPINISSEQVHEIFVDQHEIELDATTGRVNQRGSFNSVCSSLQALRESGITIIYLMGALARDNGQPMLTSPGVFEYERPDASPFAVSCRCTANEMVGGIAGLLNLLREAKRVGIKVVCDAQVRVSSSRPHRKYESYFLKYVDSTGKLATLYGCGGRAAAYEDTCLLNYRHVEAWDLMVADMAYMAGVVGVDGFRLENCQSWPPTMEADATELSRCDADGVNHYKVMEQLLGSVVKPFSEEKSGFWSTTAARTWCNPFLIKICKTLWQNHPGLVLLGECFGADREHDRQNVLCRSGVIPQLQDIPVPLARLFGQAINPDDSTVTPCQPASVKAISEWFDANHSELPEGAIVVQSSCSHSSPLPGLLYGKGAWPAVDLLFLLPDVPSTFAGEIKGKSFRLGITNVFSSSAMRSGTEIAPQQLVKLKDATSPNKSGLGTGPHLLTALRALKSFEPVSDLEKLEAQQAKDVGPEFGFDLSKIHAHYTHRRRLRHTLRIFRNGILVPLGASMDGSWHPRILAFLRFDPESGEFVLVAINFSDVAAKNVEISLRPLGFQYRDMGMEPGTVFAATDLLKADLSDNSGTVLLGQKNTLAEVFKLLPRLDEVRSMIELLHVPQSLNIGPYKTVCMGFRPMRNNELTSEIYEELYYSSLCGLEQMVRGAMTHAILRNEPVPSAIHRNLRFNFVMEGLLSATQESGLSRLASVVIDIDDAMKRRNSEMGHNLTIHDLVVDSGLLCSTAAQKFNADKWRALCSKEGGGAAVVLSSTDAQTELAEKLVAKMMAMASSLPSTEHPTSEVETRVNNIAKDFVTSNSLGPIVVVTTELGKWSTIGGLGVMVDELSCTLAQHLGQTVYVVTPYYNFDRRGNPAYMDPDEVRYASNISVDIGGETIVVGVHEGNVRGVNLIFLHNARFFPHPYPSWTVPDALRYLAIIGKASLEVLCQKRLIPQLLVTNDWPTGLVPAYAKNTFFFGEVFSSTTFFHIVHNLDANYEGRIYSDRGLNYGWITELSTELLVDPTWTQYLFNPSRCALLTCDAWGTVSPSYSEELRRPGGSALGNLLSRYPTPFAYPNGVPLAPRLKQLAELKFKTHDEAKAELQRIYFGFENPDLSIPLFAFIGRITEQKGVHHILEAVEQILGRFNYKVQILIGGRVTWNDPYSAYCGRKMDAFRVKYPFCFWADPNEFFSNGPLVNLGADVGLMPSKFEPGGIVQHEFFIAGTPVLAFRTGGLRDTVYEFDWESMTGNGFTFEAYQLGDFLYATERAYRVVSDQVRYERLRENARYSVVSCEQVAQAWLMEFCRLRRKLPVNNSRVLAMAANLKSQWNLSAWAAAAQTCQPSISHIVPPASPRSSPTAKLGEDDINTTGQQPIAQKLQKEVKKVRRDPRELVPLKIRYTPRCSTKPRAVAVSGSFDGWHVRRPMVWEFAVQSFILNLALQPGTYYYKLVVDGDWELNQDVPSITNADGIKNNVLIVE